MSFDTPVINASGEVAFAGTLDQPPSTLAYLSDSGIWKNTGGALALVVRENTAAPGAPGTEFDQLRSFNLRINAAGDVAFSGNIRIENNGGISLQDTTVWTDRNGTLNLLAREGRDAPGTGGADFNFIQNLRFDDNGNTAFTGGLRSGPGINNDNNGGLWASSGNSTSLIYRENTDVPGLGGPDFDTFWGVARNGTGDMLIRAALQRDESGVTFNNDMALVLRESNGSASVIAREGSAAPGVAGAVFNNIQPDTVINGARDVVFTGLMRAGTGGVTFDNDFGIWTKRVGQATQLLAREGDAAPGAGGATFSVFVAPTQNGAGEVAFRSTLTQGTAGVTSDNDGGLWYTDSGTLGMLAREGDDAPGAPGVAFESFGRPIINAKGDIAFTADLVAGGDADNGLWAYFADIEEFVMIAREGELFDVDSDPLIEDLRTIESVLFADEGSLGSGFGYGLNDAGTLAFALAFTDGSQGVFTVTIPAPGVLAVLAIAGLAGVRRRR